MSKKCIEFLRNSFLFQDNLVELNYSRFTDGELLSELQRYRTYVLSIIDDINSEIMSENGKLNVCVETFNQSPSENLYKQLILYMDQIVIPDPLFKQTEKQADTKNIMDEFIGLKKSKELDRGKLCKTIQYIKYISTMIEDGFVVMSPLSLMHEAPKEIPIKYSPTAFSDNIPQEILKYYHSLADVRNFVNCGTGLQIKFDEALTLGTGIHIRFSDHDHDTGSIFQYMKAKLFDFDEKTGKSTMRWTIPDKITKKEFSEWVNQSVNQAANRHFIDRYSELIFSKKCGCMYLSQSTLTASVLNIAVDKPPKEAELATMAMQINLPVVEQIPLNDLLSIRKSYGEAFHNFRVDLNSKLLSLDTMDDRDRMIRQIDSIAYELNNIQVKEVEKEYRKIVRTLKIDAIALSASLIASFAMGGVTAVGAAAASVRSLTDVAKYFTDVNEHNGFFLWKLNKRAEKYTI